MISALDRAGTSDFEDTGSSPPGHRPWFRDSTRAFLAEWFKRLGSALVEVLTALP
jgi:hypothetical protein